MWHYATKCYLGHSRSSAWLSLHEVSPPQVAHNSQWRQSWENDPNIAWYSVFGVVAYEEEWSDSCAKSGVVGTLLNISSSQSWRLISIIDGVLRNAMRQHSHLRTVSTKPPMSSVYGAESVDFNSGHHCAHLVLWLASYIWTEQLSDLQASSGGFLAMSRSDIESKWAVFTWLDETDWKGRDTGTLLLMSDGVWSDRAISSKSRMVCLARVFWLIRMMRWIRSIVGMVRDIIRLC